MRVLSEDNSNDNSKEDYSLNSSSSSELTN